MAFRAEFITLIDLCAAYRKAKSEAFHSTNCAQGQKFAAFEKRLEFNLQLLLQKLTAPKATWFEDADFLGKATCIAKSVTPNETNGAHFSLSDPLEDWKRLHVQNKAKAEFRPVIDATIDFQIISALWIMKVGHEFDACLDTRFAVGNRLRRWRAPDSAPAGSVGSFNFRSHSLFQPYYHAYGGWRQRGLNAMKEKLDAQKHIVAVTMDLKKFYHQVDANFLLHPDYLRASGVVLDSDQRKFTRQLIASIATWNKRAKKLTDSPQYGLPVGLTASGVIANVLLKEFDDGIQSLRPAYYGRYVDDIFLVLSHSGFKDSNELMQWLSKRMRKITRYSVDTDGSPILHVVFPYSGKSELLFTGKKQKVFQLKGQHGLDLISPIEEQIRRQKSEHEGLPDLPDREAAMAARALLVSSDATLETDALRKADAVTLRRAGFAMLLSSVEQHVRNVELRSWKTVRLQFYGLAERHLLTPQGFFDYARYFPRILGLMIECQEYRQAEHYIRSVSKLMAVVRSTCDLRIKELDACCRTLAERMIEVVLQARQVERKKAAVGTIFELIRKKLSPTVTILQNENIIRRRAEQLFLADWSKRSYGSTWLESQTLTETIQNRPSIPAVRQFVRYDAFKRLKKAADIQQPFHWPALAFPTRRIAIAEITAYAPDLLRDYETLADVIQSIRGTWVAPISGLRVHDKTTNAPQTIDIPKEDRAPVYVAVTNFETSSKEWQSAVKEQPVLTLPRYRRVNRFINHLLATTPRPSYVLFPECSIPRRWARTIATKLSLKGISIIAGLEYLRGKAGLRNEVLISLNSNFIGYRDNIVILQSKLAPAWGEQEEIAANSTYSLQPPGQSSLQLPVYAHGDVCFAVLICSDLTTLSNRNLLQGHIDCLFVPEWNQDLETFAALIEASTHDLHAYVIQANNRLYGDSRIRGPYRQNFRRDVVRVRGGLHDYFVTDAIDIQALREFQRNQKPPNGDKALFKPFPVGYKMSNGRR